MAGRIRKFFAGAAGLALLTTTLSQIAVAGGPPKTGFEERNGASWTTHDEELDFLATVEELSDRVAIDVIGETGKGLPLHLVQLGFPRPAPRKAAAKGQSVLFTCSQHGNEPAGREACLRLLRDLAFTDDKALLKQLSGQTILFVPNANPDGREANTRGNSLGTDINRDHITLETPEARAIAAVVRDWKPDAVIDLHEYGPSLPPVYDDEILYLWPRNLNIDQKVHDLAYSLANDYIEPKSEEAGYTADEYGQYEVGDQNIYQSAGDQDEGINRNLMGLRHSLGILVESNVSQEPRNGPDELTTEAAVNLRRVESQYVVTEIVLEFMRDKGDEVEAATEGAAKRKTLEGRKQSAPVYFGGADNDPPEEAEMQDPPPCAYEVSRADFDKARTLFNLLDIRSRRSGDSILVYMGQPSEPLIPLVLDERGARHTLAAKPIMKCSG